MSNDMLMDNIYAETQELILELDRKLGDEDVETAEAEFGVNLKAGAIHYISTYSGYSNFITDLKVHLIRKGSLSLPQIRGALNVMRNELKSGKLTRVVKGQAIPLIANPTPTAPEVPLPGGAEPVSVIAEKEESLLDITSIPDGRYAIPDLSQKNDFVFLMVKTIKKRIYRDRKYRFGKFRTGQEWIEPGTIEVRQWSQDAKELVGYAKPGEGYKGEFIDQLVDVIKAPEAFALLFSLTIGRCSVCGKTLTDDTSREMTIGPECFKRWGYNYWKNWSRAAVLATPTS